MSSRSVDVAISLFFAYNLNISCIPRFRFVCVLQLIFNLFVFLLVLFELDLPCLMAHLRFLELMFRSWIGRFDTRRVLSHSSTANKYMSMLAIHYFLQTIGASVL